MLGEIKAGVEILLAREETNSARIGRVEKWQWTSAGATGALAILIPFILKFEPIARLFQ